MNHPRVISTRAELLLTSGGVVTDPMRDRLNELRRVAGGRHPRVVRVADGWTAFGKSDPVSRLDRLEQRGEGIAASLWSRRYLTWALGKRATIETVVFGQKTTDEVQKLLDATDILVVPGANTYQTSRGLSRHADTLRAAVGNGMPYVGESAGSIIAGLTLKPATLAPADTCPDNRLLHAAGLGLIEADIVVHAKSAEGEGAFDVRGLQAFAARLALSGISSNARTYTPDDSDTVVYALADRQALSVHNGTVELI